MNISCHLDSLKKSKDTSNRRNSLPEYTAFEQKKGKNYNAFNTKTKKTIKLLSKSNDGMIEYDANVSLKSNDCKIIDSNTYGTIKIQNSTFETHRSLDSSTINMSMSNITDSLEGKKCKSLQKIFNDLDTLQNDACIDNDNAHIVAESINPNEISTIQYGHRKNQRMKFVNCNEKSQSKYDIPEKKTAVTKNNEMQECTEDSTMRDIDGQSIESKIVKEKSNTSTSNYNEKLHLYCLHNKVLVIMQEKTSFCFTGKLVINVLYGAIEVYGSHITTSNSPIEVYSPRGYSLVAVETSKKFLMSDIKDIWTYLSQEGINPDIKNALQCDINRCRPGMAVIILWNLENNLTTFVNTYYPIKLFPKIRNVKNYSWTDTRRAEMILQSNLYFDNHNYKRLVIDPTVTGILAEKILNRWYSHDWSCTLIAGGKNVGKSTTVRYLINTLLPTSRMVVLVDVDPGQNECTPPGCISYSLIEEPLAGPNFTHLKTPVYQLYIGDVNVTRCITRYIESVKLLANKLLSCPTMSRLPIIINTMGFTQGIGWDIVVFTIKLFRPSFVLQIMSERTKNNYPNLLSSDIIDQQTFTGFSWSKNITDWNKPCLHELQVINTNAEKKQESTSDSWNMEPYQQRELAMISYLSGIVNSNGNSTFPATSASLSINEAVPFVAPFASLTIALLRECVPPSRVLTVINGNMVALCGIDLTRDLLQDVILSIPRILTRAPLCTCYGYGIIRGIDTDKEEVYINTPLPLSLMRHVNCLIGSIPIPVNLLQLNQRNVPYAGGNDALPTSRDPRRGYFRMRYENRQTSS
ncbi:polynucleotide 5'-hydroxyl-kinase NOL9 isoform X2 [Vespula pensylvanica]|uniref:polynucleotide 5'-hydroxyl-kinase NOL9 isoform X2 n=1 Tax=Vespula pensylvanica TaxID=30213 RepID=UPI001CBA0912|nr:polynucleotide 5'-hydroxyl-kinase NOL9 isoform X2 [Vespula pensylvanica]